MAGKKVLILYAAVGLGHKAIAENIGFSLEQGGYQVKLYDAQKLQGGFLAVRGKRLYQWIVPHLPFIWNWLYNTDWFLNAASPYRIKVAAKNYKHVLQVIQEFKPDAVISCHVTSSAILAYLKLKDLYSGKFGIAFSDFHLHRFWLFYQADFYLANTQDQKQEMTELGITEKQIFVCGITLKPKAEVNIESIKTKFEVEMGDKVVLIASGSQGFGVDEALISQIISHPKIKVIVLCGNNRKIFEYLSNKFAGTNATILTYHSFMDELYAIADIFITKPGGLSVAEALRWQIPILISHMLPGGEQYNYIYLQEKGLVMPEPINITESVLEELETASFKNALAQNPNLGILLNPPQSAVLALNQALEKSV